ncbi:Spindle pole body protein pcp1 [Escovopsis weberi]|uniref:Spindle pole body protein pcp1 n=1 Tax=Escovopsis weberi TaxID=150374 RepID=A0A0M8N1W1_ESCWE|nr:Spindle pole body protein pcp1 [Escovopsis weberi]
MAHARFGGVLDTPRTTLGDATYLGQPDFADISQEATFISPSKEDNLLQHLRNGRANGARIGTPRRKGLLVDRQNLPPSIGGAEFTPLLKSATRNSSRLIGKENGAGVASTPAALSRFGDGDESMTPIPRMDASIFSSSRNRSFVDHTLPQVDADASSNDSTPIALPPRRAADKGPLDDGNQLSLREQENVIDRIEKENFGLKLKIHFLEEALQKSGPGFSEAALKENTELKVDKVTMQRELHKYKKHLTTAEKDLETYRQQVVELQEKAKRKHADENQRAELEKVQQALEEREADIENLHDQLRQGQKDKGQLEVYKDNVMDLEAELREKDRVITERDDEIENIRDRLDEAENKARDLEEKVAEQEEAALHNEELEEAQDTIQDLRSTIRQLEKEVSNMKQKQDEAVAERERAEQDLEELQEEMANKSVVTKGLSRQIEEKVVRLQDELDKSGRECASLEKELATANHQNHELKTALSDVRREHGGVQQERKSFSAKIKELETELLAQADAKDLLQSRHDSLTMESSSLQQDVRRLENEVRDLSKSLAEERAYGVEIEKDLRGQYEDELQRLNLEVSDLQAEIREKDNLYDNDSEKWETARKKLLSDRDRAEEKAAGLQRTIDRLRDAEGAISSKESKLQEAIQSEMERHKSEEGVLNRQINDLHDALETRQNLLTTLRNELSTIRDELRQTQIDYQTQVNKVVALENEVEVLRANMAGAGSAKAQEVEAAKRECEVLKQQLRRLQDDLDLARVTSSTTEQTAQQSTESVTRLRWQLSDANTQLTRADKDREALREQLDKIGAELRSVQSSLAEANAEREELNVELRRIKSHDNETHRVDQDRLDLRAAKIKLDNEVRRLKDENKALAEQRTAIEKVLEEEIEKAAEEEERLSQEILDLQSKIRSSSSSETQDIATARRTIRELERKIETYQAQLAEAPRHDGLEGSSEILSVRRDLTSARQKEIDALQRESSYKDTIKGLKRQVSELERQLHEREVSRLIMSPRSPSGGLSQRNEEELAALREQLKSAHQSIYDLKSKNRDVEKMAIEAAQELQGQLEDVEDQKVVLEEVLDEAKQQAEETAELYERTLQRMKQKLEKAERERDAVAAAHTETDNQGKRLRKSQAEIENLEHDVLHLQEVIDELVASEEASRRKLERARSERAAYRMSAEKLQRDLQQLRARMETSEPDGLRQNGTSEALETLVRAAEGAEERHKKELKGMVMQMGWMQRRWEREASLRSDAAYAKKFLQLQLDVANACNNAQLREMEHIRTNLLQSRKPLAPLSAATGSSSSSSRGSAADPAPKAKAKARLKSFLLMARFIARMRIAARGWAAQEMIRRKIAEAVEEKRKAKRTKLFKVVRAEEAC